MLSRANVFRRHRPSQALCLEAIDLPRARDYVALSEMRRPLLSRLTYANAMSTIAVFLALGGVGYAVAKLPANSVGPRQIKKNAVSSSKVKDRSLTVSDLSKKTRSKLKGASGPQGLQGASGPTGPAGATLIDSPVPSGKTIKGVWGGQYPPLTGAGSGPGNASFVLSTSFPAPLPVPITDATAQFSTNSFVGGTSPTVAAATTDADEDPDCSGTLAAPTAPAGKLCLYVRDARISNVTNGTLHVQGPASDDDPGAAARTLGFEVSFTANENTMPVRVEGVWVYTAP